MTGTLAVYTLIFFIRHLHLHSETQEAEQHHFEKKRLNQHKSHKQMNHERDKHCETQKYVQEQNWNKRKNTQTQRHNHNTKNKLETKESQKRVISGENTGRETNEREGKNWSKHRECWKKKKTTRPKGFCKGMQAQLHSPIMQQVLVFTRAGFPWQHVQESLSVQKQYQRMQNEKRPHNANIKVN